MTIGEKYSKVLTVSKKKAYKAEDLCRFGRNTISNAIKENRLLSEEYHKIFMTVMGVNPEWWAIGKGEVLLKNGTSVQNEPAVTSKSSTDAASIYEELYQRFLGANSEYLMIHRDVLKQHRLVAVEQLEEDKKRAENHQAELEKRSNDIQALTAAIREIAMRPINIHMSDIQRTKE